MNEYKLRLMVRFCYPGGWDIQDAIEDAIEEEREDGHEVDVVLDEVSGSHADGWIFDAVVYDEVSASDKYEAVTNAEVQQELLGAEVIDKTVVVSELPFAEDDDV